MNEIHGMCEVNELKGNDTEKAINETGDKGVRE
jgi:hypothetical protein